MGWCAARTSKLKDWCGVWAVFSLHGVSALVFSLHSKILTSTRRDTNSPLLKDARAGCYKHSVKLLIDLSAISPPHIAIE